MTEEKTEKQPEKRTVIAEIYPDAARLAEHLQEKKMGDLVTYAEIEKFLGYSILKAKRYILYSALRVARREEGIIFETIRSVGIKRQNDSEIADYQLKRSLGQVRRCAKRGLERARCADYEKLSKEEKTRANARSTILSMQLDISKRKAERRIREAMEISDKIPKIDLLKQFIE